jgi:hypothetical protein
MSLNISTIQQAFYDWVSTKTGVTTIWFFPNAPRPERPYISLNIAELSINGWDYETPPDATGLASLFGDRDLTLEINHYGPGGFEALDKLRTSVLEFAVQQDLCAAGIGLVDRMPITNTTELLDTKYEPRAMMEMMFRISNQGITDADTYDVGLIESVEGTACVVDDNGNVLYETDFNVPNT